MKKINVFLLLAMIVIACNVIAESPATGQNQAVFTQADHDNIIKTQTEMKDLRNEMIARFEAADKRFEQMLTFMGWIIASFIAITLGSIGYAWRDRRMAMKPLENRTKVIELDVEQLKQEPTLARVLASLREVAKTNEKLFESLKNNNLL